MGKSIMSIDTMISALENIQYTVTDMNPVDWGKQIWDDVNSRKYIAFTEINQLL